MTAFSVGAKVRCKWGSESYDAVVQEVFSKGREYDVWFPVDNSIGRVKAAQLKLMEESTPGESKRKSNGNGNLNVKDKGKGMGKGKGKGKDEGKCKGKAKAEVKAEVKLEVEVEVKGKVKKKDEGEGEGIGPNVGNTTTPQNGAFPVGTEVRCKWGTEWYDAVVREVFLQGRDYDVWFPVDNSIGRVKAAQLELKDASGNVEKNRNAASSSTPSSAASANHCEMSSYDKARQKRIAENKRTLQLLKGDIEKARNVMKDAAKESGSKLRKNTRKNDDDDLWLPDSDEDNVGSDYPSDDAQPTSSDAPHSASENFRETKTEQAPDLSGRSIAEDQRYRRSAQTTGGAENKAEFSEGDQDYDYDDDEEEWDGGDGDEDYASNYPSNYTTDYAPQNSAKRDTDDGVRTPSTRERKRSKNQGEDVKFVLLPDTSDLAVKSNATLPELYRPHISTSGLLKVFMLQKYLRNKLELDLCDKLEIIYDVSKHAFPPLS